MRNPINEKTKIVPVRIPVEVYAEIQVRAQERLWSAQTWIRQALKAQLQSSSPLPLE